MNPLATKHARGPHQPFTSVSPTDGRKRGLNLLAVPNEDRIERTGTAASGMSSSPQTHERSLVAASPTARQERGSDLRGGVSSGGQRGNQHSRMRTHTASGRAAASLFLMEQHPGKQTGSGTGKPHRWNSAFVAAAAKILATESRTDPFNAGEHAHLSLNRDGRESRQAPVARGLLHQFRPRKGRARQALYVAGNVLGGAALFILGFWMVAMIAYAVEGVK